MEEMQRSLGRIEGKLDTVSEALRPIEKRVGSLERSRSYATGMAAVCAAAAAAAWGLVK